MCRGVWRAKISGGVFQVAKFVVRGGKGETENLADKGCYGQPLCTPSKFTCLAQRVRTPT